MKDQIGQAFKDAPRERDFTFADHGSIIIVNPETPEAKAWLDETAPKDAQWWGSNGLVVEPRYIEMFCEAAADAGFSY